MFGQTSWPKGRATGVDDVKTRRELVTSTKGLRKKRGGRPYRGFDGLYKRTPRPPNSKQRQPRIQPTFGAPQRTRKVLKLAARPRP